MNKYLTDANLQYLLSFRYCIYWYNNTAPSNPLAWWCVHSNSRSPTRCSCQSIQFPQWLYLQCHLHTHILRGSLSSNCRRFSGQHVSTVTHTASQLQLRLAISCNVLYSFMRMISCKGETQEEATAESHQNQSIVVPQL